MLERRLELDRWRDDGVCMCVININGESVIGRHQSHSLYDEQCRGRGRGRGQV